MRNFLIVISLTLLWTSPAFADPVTIIVAAVAAAGTTGIAYATGYFVAGVAFSTVFGYFAATFGLTLALGYIAQALAPSPALNVNRGYTVAGISPAADQAVIYGQTRVGGISVHKEVTDQNRWLLYVIAIAGHECEDVLAIYFDDVRVEIGYETDNRIHIYNAARNGRSLAQLKGLEDIEDRDFNAERIGVEIYFGDRDQLASRRLVGTSDELWTDSHRLRGICYAYVRLKFDSDAWPNGEPNMSFDVKGKRVYDPRTRTTAWSDNSALIMRDYIESDFGVNDDSIDDKTFASAANICDEMVVKDPNTNTNNLSEGGNFSAIGGGDSNFEKRYTANGSFRVGSAVKEVMNDINLSMGRNCLVHAGEMEGETRPLHPTNFSL